MTEIQHRYSTWALIILIDVELFQLPQISSLENNAKKYILPKNEKGTAEAIILINIRS